jgi:non-ribosomal peptide synthetase-like protein
VSGECFVAVLLPRDSERLYEAQLAVLKAGAAHACIDPGFPDGQLAEILSDLRPVVLLTDSVGADRVRGLGPDIPNVLNLDDWRSPTCDTSGVSPASWLTPQSLAYVIYTSGTTGRPKGVMIEHASIANLVRANFKEFDIGPRDRVAQGSSSSYDSSVEETWLALSAGATLVVMDDDAVRLGPDLIPWLRRECITVLCPPPTLLRAASCADPERALPDLRLLYVGGEPLTDDVANKWGTGRLLVNGYGPTECTVTCVRGRILPGDPITIGNAVPGLKALVLDDQLDEVGNGDQGELCLSGVGLARGYLGRPELTAQRFPIHRQLGRIYRTGDLVCRGLDGRLTYRGRIDAQVKLRGYRIELEAIEARLAECDGVLGAACKVEGEGTHGKLAAFIVAVDPHRRPDPESLMGRLRHVLPPYMIPSHFSFVLELPTTVGGKLDRGRLPAAEESRPLATGKYVGPRNTIEAAIAAAFQQTLAPKRPVSIDDDFFDQLGGDSLRAALLVSRLRENPATACLAVRDVYEAPTVAELARRVESAPRLIPVASQSSLTSQGRPVLATLVQIAWLVTGLVLGSAVAYAVAFHAIPFVADQFGIVTLLVATPVVSLCAFAGYAIFALVLAVAAKRILIGHYVPVRAPVWGGFYVRNWMVQQAVRLIPWQAISGTAFQIMALRALGARIGRRVHIHRGVDLLQGGWDLLEIGDDVSIGQDASIQLVELAQGQVIVSPVVLGRGSTLEVRAGVGGDTRLDDGAYLTALSHLQRGQHIPRGERWEGVPAQPAGRAPAAPIPSPSAMTLPPILHSVILMSVRAAVGAVAILPLELLAIVFGLIWMSSGSASLTSTTMLIGIATVVASVPLTLVLQALAARATGRVHEGVIDRWSLAYIRVWLKSSLVQAAGDRLSGSLLWPVWLRAAGMKVGRGCEISTIIDVVPEMVEIGDESFLADGIYLGGARIHRGTVTLRKTRLGRNTFLGNHAVIAEGQSLPEGVLFGIATVADGMTVSPGSSWFGHPPFQLPRREVVTADRRMTHTPSRIRYWNRVLWETARCGLPVVPFLAAAAWYEVLATVEGSLSTAAVALVLAPVMTFAGMLAMCVLMLAIKWGLLGRVRPGTHPLWSCWCCRWDFMYMAWAQYAWIWLAPLEGTLLLPWYLRAMGSRIGRRVTLGGGFAQIVDPDMLVIEDEATVNAMFQAHTFEDRVLKIDRVTIRREASVGNAAVLLYGADIGAAATVLPHSVVMKHEHLVPGNSYAGCPTRPVG